MRVLLLTQVVVYPADAGPKIKTLQVLKHLASRHEVVYCTFVRNAQEEHAVQKLSEICRRVSTVPIKRSPISNARFLVESLLTGDSYLMRRDDRIAMQKLVRQLLREERIEVLHVDQLNMMRFVPSDWTGTVILDEHNAVWQVVDRLCKGQRNPVSRWVLGREVRLIRKLEGEACRRADLVLAVSEQDQNALREVTDPLLPIEVIPITVDTEKFASLYHAREPEPTRLFTVGNMFWPPNNEGVIWWLRHGYEKLRALCPGITYDVVGARPPRALQILAQQHSVGLPGHVADIEQYWRRAGALAVPLLSGGGVRVKILEAMAMGVPVVSTSIGCEGLAVRDGEHLLVADTAEDFAHACARVLLDRDLAWSLAQNARQLMIKEYDSKVALRRLDFAYEETRHHISTNTPG